MPTDLTNAEKEDREVERLINKKPAPSRKNREKRGPKFDNRRTVMRTEKDPDLSNSDPDLSGGNKYSFDNSWGEDMVLRTSGYNGIVERAHEGDREVSLQAARVFDPIGEDDHKLLIKAAKATMKQEWFVAGWGDDDTDAPMRAALDTSIATCEDSVYQSRIDPQTYNLLLGKLLGEDIDQTVESFFDEGYLRSELSMNPTQNTILAAASKLRHSNPRLAVELVRSIRTASPTPGLVDEKVKGEMDKKLQELLQAITDEDIEAFGASMKEMAQLLPKTASSRIASEFLEFQSLADLPAEELKSFFDKEKKQVEQSKKLLESNEIEEFMITFDSLMKDSEDAAKKAKQGSVRVKLSTLVRLAAASPEAAAVLLPVLAAAKKKMSKPAKTSGKDKKEDKDEKKPAKKDDKSDKKPAKKDDKKPAGKKPAGKKDEKKPAGKSNLAPPFKKKASFQSDDLDW